jgi:hypothetical protein
MNILQEAFEKGYTYTGYRNLVDKLFEEGKSTGPIQNDEMLHYSEMNIARMRRWDKRLELKPEVVHSIRVIGEKQNWILITEGWCGDAAHSVPVIGELAKLNPNIELRVVLRDEHLELMDQYLTNGGRAIPKLIISDANFKELTHWGPRPQELQEIFVKQKADGMDMGEAKKQLQLWYSRNRGEAIQLELASLFD